MNCTVEYGTPEDGNSIVNLLRISFPDSEFPDNYYKDMSKSKTFKEWIVLWSCVSDEKENEKENEKEKAKEKKRELIACCMIIDQTHNEMKNKSVYYLCNVAVDPKFRKQGYGRYLMNIVVNRYNYIYWTVVIGEKNTNELNAFYKKCGYEYFGSGIQYPKTQHERNVYFYLSNRSDENINV